MSDRSTKILLAILAAGIWANVAVSLRPAPASAQATVENLLVALLVSTDQIKANTNTMTGYLQILATKR